MATVDRVQGNDIVEVDDLLHDLRESDGKTIPYRAELARATGGVTSALLLQQVIFWWQVSEGRPFFKFKEPCCKHPAYRPGDSWTEELGFSRREFDAARGRIATRRRSGMSWEQACAEGRPVIYWATPGRMTFYAINPVALAALLEAALTPPQIGAKVETKMEGSSDYRGNGPDSQRRKRPLPNGGKRRY